MNQPSPTCPNCGQTLPPDSQFCGACGTEIRPSPPPQRRVAWLGLLVGILTAASGAVAAILVLNQPQPSTDPAFTDQLQDKGGLELLFEISGQVDPALVEQGLPVLEKRLSSAGYNGQVRSEGANAVRVTLLGAANPETAAELLSDPGLLEIVASGNYAPLPGETIFTDLPGSPPAGANGMVFHTVLTNSAILSAEVKFESETSIYQIWIQLTPEAQQVFADFTRDHINQYAAIVYNHQCLISPRITSPILEGQVVIQGSLSLEDARRIAAAMNSGVLPYPLQLKESRAIPPGSP